MDTVILVAALCALLSIASLLLAQVGGAGSRRASVCGISAFAVQYAGTIIAVRLWPHSDSALEHGIFRSSVGLASALGLVAALVCRVSIRGVEPASPLLRRMAATVLGLYLVGGVVGCFARDRAVTFLVSATYRSTGALLAKAIEAADARARAKLAGPSLEVGWKDAWKAADLDEYGADRELMRRGAAATPRLLSSLRALPVDRTPARLHIVDLLLAGRTAETSNLLERYAADLSRSDVVRRRVFDSFRKQACIDVRSSLAPLDKTSACIGAPAVMCMGAHPVSATVRQLSSVAAYYSERIVAALEKSPVDAFTVDRCLPIRLQAETAAPNLDSVWVTGLREVIVFAFVPVRDGTADALLASWTNSIPQSSLRGASLVLQFADGTSAAARAGDP